MNIRGTGALAGAALFTATAAWSGGKWKGSTSDFQAAPAQPITAPAAAGAGSPANDGYHPYGNFGGASGGAGAGMKDASPFSNFGGQKAAEAAANPTKVGAAAADPNQPFKNFGKPSAVGPKAEAAGQPGSSPAPEAAAAVAAKPAEPPPETEEDRALRAESEKAEKHDAAENFPTLIQTYLAQNGSDGRLLVKDGGKTRELEFVAVDAKSLRKAGDGRYAACAAFREAGGKRRVPLELTADFSGPEWKVTSVKPRSKSGPCAD